MTELNRTIDRSGENNPQWKGDEASVKALHFWVYARKTRLGFCERCGRTPLSGWTDFANISGEYRRDIDDYIELCRSCHRLFDNGSLAVADIRLKDPRR